MALEKIVFVLNDKLPTIYDAAIMLYEVAQAPKSKKMYFILISLAWFFKQVFEFSLYTDTPFFYIACVACGKYRCQ